MNLRKIIQFSLGPIGTAILSLITLPIATWFFSVDDIGRLSMLQVSISLSILLCALGLDQAFVREYHVIAVKCRPSLFKTTLLPGCIVFFIIALLLVLLSSCFNFSISSFIFGIDSSNAALALFACVVFSFVSRFLGIVLRMEERAISYSLTLICPKLLFLLLLLSFYFVALDRSFVNLLALQTSSIVIAFILLVLFVRQFLLKAISSSVDVKYLKMMLSYSLPLVGSGLAFWGLTVTDKIFLRGYSSFHELGIYSVAYSFAGAGLILKAVFSTVWAPTVYKWHSEGDDDKTLNIIDSMSILTILIWSLSGMFSWVLTYFLPSNYEGVQTLFLIAIAYPLLYTLSEATSIGIGIKRKTMLSLFAVAFALAINVIGNYLLIPSLGAVGAGISSAVAFFIFFFMKTELSVRVYLPFKRVRLYFLLSLLTFFSILINLFEVSSILLFLLYGFILLLSLHLYKSSLFMLYLKAKDLSSAKGTN